MQKKSKSRRTSGLVKAKGKKAGSRKLSAKPRKSPLKAAKRGTKAGGKALKSRVNLPVRARAESAKTRVPIRSEQGRPLADRLTNQPELPYKPNSAFVENNGGGVMNQNQMVANNKRNRPLTFHRNQVGNRHH